MGYYDRNKDLKLELAREKYRTERATQNATETAEDTQNRTNTIERMLTERRAQGDQLPQPGATIEHRSGKLKSVGRLLDYDLNTKGELVAVLLPHRETREEGPALIVTRVEDIFNTDKKVSEINLR